MQKLADGVHAAIAHAKIGPELIAGRFVDSPRYGLIFIKPAFEENGKVVMRSGCAAVHLMECRFP